MRSGRDRRCRFRGSDNSCRSSGRIRAASFHVDGRMREVNVSNVTSGSGRRRSCGAARWRNVFCGRFDGSWPNRLRRRCRNPGERRSARRNFWRREHSHFRGGMRRRTNSRSSFERSARANGNSRERVAANHARLRFGTNGFFRWRKNNRRSRRTQRGTRRQNRRRQRGISDGEVERFRLLRLERLQLFFFAELASDFAERRLLRFCIGVERVLGILRRRRGTIFLWRARFLSRLDGSRIFRRQDAVTLQVFVGVDVLGGFLRFLFASAFLPRGIGNILRRGNRRGDSQTG